MLAATNGQLYAIGIAGEAEDKPDEADGDRETTGVDDTNTNRQTARESGGIDISGVVAINNLIGITVALVDGGVTLDLDGKLEVLARGDVIVLSVSAPFALDRSKNENSNSDSSTSGSGQTGMSLSVAGAYTNNNVNLTTTASTGTVTVSDVTDVTIDARTKIRLVATSAGAAGQINNKAPNSTVAIAGSVNLNELTTNTAATLGGATVLTAPGVVTVLAADEIDFSSDAGGHGRNAQFGVGAGIDVSIIKNTTQALIADGAQINLGTDNVFVLASSTIKGLSVAASIGLNSFSTDATKEVKLGIAGAGGYVEVVNNIIAEIGDATITTDDNVVVDASDLVELVVIAGSAAGAELVGVGFSFSGANITHNVTARIDDGATITALGSGATVKDPSEQVEARGVIVDATAHDNVWLIAAAGALAQGMKSFSLAAAGSVTVLDVGGLVLAEIGSATVQAGAPASPEQQEVRIRARHDGDLNSIAGVIAANLRKSTQDGGTGPSGAASTNTGSGEPGAESGGSGVQVSLGASIGLNDIATEVRARAIGADIDADGGVTILAESAPEILVISVAGSLSNDSQAQTGGASGSTSGQGGGFGLGGAGAGSGNQIDNVIVVLVQGGTITTTDGGSVVVRALDDSSITADAGGVAFVRSTNGASSLSFGISAATNEINNEVTAIVDGATINSDDDITVQSLATPDIFTLTIGGAFAESGSSGSGSGGGSGGGSSGLQLALAGAGAGSGNTIANTVEVTIINATLVADDDIVIEASELAIITADAGGVAVSKVQSGGKAISIGAAVAINEIADTVSVTITNSSLTAGDRVEVAAREASIINALALAGAFTLNSGTGGGTGSGFEFAGAGAVTINKIGNVVRVLIDGTSTLTAGGDVMLTVGDVSLINADAGGVALGVALSESKATIAAAAAAAVNRIGNETTALSDGATINSGGLTQILAQSAALISVLALGIAGAISLGSSQSGGGGVSFAGAGSGASNTVNNLTKATVSGGTLAVANLGVTSVDSTLITADAGAVAIALSRGPPIAVGISVAINEISNTTTSLLDGTGLTLTAGDVDVTATSTYLIDAVTFSVGGSVGISENNAAYGFAGAGSGSGNTVTNTLDAKVANLVTTGISGDLRVTAAEAADDEFDLAPASLADQLDDLAVEEGDDPSTLGTDENADDLADDAAALAALQPAFAVEGIGLSADTQVVILTRRAGDPGDATTGETTRWLVRDPQNGVWVVERDGSDLRVVSPSAIRADAGGGALAVGFSSEGTAATGAFAAAAAANRIANSVTASIVDSDIDVGGDIVVEAFSSPTIDTFAFGLSAGASVSGGGSAFAFAGAGAGSGNQIGDVDGTPAQTIAEVVNSTLDAGGAITVQAGDESVITADAGGVSISIGVSQSTSVPVAIGASVAINTIVKSVRARIVDSTITDATALTVDAGSATQSEALTLAGAFGVGVSSDTSIGVSAVGAVSINDVAATVEALIDGSMILLTGPVSVTASEAGLQQGTVTGGDATNLAAALDDLAVTEQDIVEYDDNGTPSDPDDDFPFDPQPAGTNESVWDITGTHGRVDDAVSFATMQTRFLAEGIALSGNTSVYVLEYDLDIDDVQFTPAYEDDDGDAETEPAPDRKNPKYDPTQDPDGYNPQIIRWLVRDGAGSTYTVERCDAGGGYLADLCIFRPALISADAGGLSISVNVGSSSAAGISVGAAVAHNTVSNTVTALVVDTTIDGATSLFVNAATAVTIDALAVGIAGAAGVGSGTSVAFSGAGAATANFITNSTTAELLRVTTDVNGTVDVVAGDESKIRADAGAGSFAVAGGGSGGISGAVGAGVTRSEIGNTVRAIVDDSGLGTAIDPANAVTVEATSTSVIDSIAATAVLAVGAGSGPGVGISLAGSVSLGKITNSVEALVRNSSVVYTGSGFDLVVRATDTSSISGDAGSGSLAVGAGSGPGVAVSGAGSIGINEIANIVRASVSDSHVVIGGDLLVEAISEASVSVVAVAISGAVGAGSAGIGVSGAGAVALNEIANTVEASLVNADVDPTGPLSAVTVNAEDRSTVTADGGGVALSVGAGSTGVGVAAGGTIADNRIGSVDIDDDDTSNLLVSSSDPNAPPVPLGPLEHTVRALVINTTIGSSGARANAVTITVSSTALIDVLAVAGAAGVGAGSVGVGAAIAGVFSTNRSRGIVEARVADSSIWTGTAHDVTVRATDDATIHLDVGAGALGVGAGLGRRGGRRCRCSRHQRHRERRHRPRRRQPDRHRGGPPGRGDEPLEHPGNGRRCVGRCGRRISRGRRRRGRVDRHQRNREHDPRRDP